MQPQITEQRADRNIIDTSVLKDGPTKLFKYEATYQI